MSRPALYPVVSPSTPGSITLHRWHLERAITHVPEDHPAVQAKAGRIHATKRSAVPQKGSTTPAAIAWHRATGTTPGHMNRHMRKRIERDADARMAFLAFGA